MNSVSTLSFNFQSLHSFYQNKVPLWGVERRRCSLLFFVKMTQKGKAEKFSRSKKTKIPPKAKNKTDTKHRTVPDTLDEMKEIRTEDLYKKTTPKHQNVQIQKEMEEGGRV